MCADWDKLGHPNTAQAHPVLTNKDRKVSFIKMFLGYYVRTARWQGGQGKEVWHYFWIITL